jgi:hypothetical protein
MKKWIGMAVFLLVLPGYACADFYNENSNSSVTPPAAVRDAAQPAAQINPEYKRLLEARVRHDAAAMAEARARQLNESHMSDLVRVDQERRRVAKEFLDSQRKQHAGQ